jgi:plastocyanin
MSALNLRIRPLAAALLMLAVCACSDDSTEAPVDAPFTGTIHIVDNRFSPANITISAGDSVTWSWEGSNSHSATQGTTPDASEDASRLFDSGIRSSGTFVYRFTAPGAVPYFCRPHFAAGMKGTITVQ